MHYTCHYCGTTLTHNSVSVRKSHAQGRNHIKYVIDYYENAAKEVGLLPKDMPSSTDGGVMLFKSSMDPNKLDQSENLKNLTKGVPGKHYRDRSQPDPVLGPFTKMPLPPHIQGLPAPPGSFYARNVMVPTGPASGR
jgi:U1 small nuclear ribonucleoprotein C